MWSLSALAARLRKDPKPIRYAPTHRPEWRRLWRYCRCGLRWPCPDRHYPGPVVPPYPMGLGNLPHPRERVLPANRSGRRRWLTEPRAERQPERRGRPDGSRGRR